MDSLIEVFHLDVKLLIAQIINFAIVFGVLYFFALKPLLAVMRERTAKIEKSLEDAKQIDEKLKNTEEDYERRIREAKKEAANIMEQARIDAEEKREKMVKKAKEDIGAIINEEKARMQTEKAVVLKEIKADMAGLIVAAVEKVLEKKMDGKTDNELINRVIGKKDISKKKRT